jgi:carboxypeptidase PM20D1
MKVKRFFSYSLATLLFLLALIFIRAYLHQPDVYEIKAERLLILDETKAIENLSRSIQFQTISHPNYEKFDYEEFQRFLSWLEREYVQVFKNLEKKYLGKTLLLKWQGEAADLNPILLTGHYDVVPVREDADLIWQESPFSGKIDGNYVWGRGALDDKSGVIAILEAVHYLLKNNFSPRRTVYLSFGHDEEIGGRRGAGKVTEFLLKEGVELEWTLDEGSFLLKDIIPGINKPVAVINVAEKGSLTIQVIGKAKGGHSSMPSSKSSVGYLSEALLKLENNPVPGKLEGISLGLFDEVSKQMPFQYKILFANLWLFEPLINNFLSDSPAMNAVIRTTTAPTMLSASNRLNVLASEAVGMVNFRLHPRDNPEKIINFVKDLIGNENIEVKKVSSGTLASSVSDWETEGYRAISNSVREVYGDIIVAPGLMVGGSDSKHYAKAAKNSYRFNPFPLSANELSGLHGIDERIKKDDFLNGIRSYIKIIQSGAN